MPDLNGYLGLPQENLQNIKIPENIQHRYRLSVEAVFC